MSKKVLTIILFLSLSLFLVMPVHAAEPPAFEKTTDVFPGDLDYRNSLVDWNGYNLEFDIIKDTAGGLDPTHTAVDLYVNGTQIFSVTTWVKLFPNDPQDYQYKLNLTDNQKIQIKNVLFDRLDGRFSPKYSGIIILARNGPGTTNGYALYFRLYFTSLLNINFKSLYIGDYLTQSEVGVINTFNKGVLLKDNQDITIANITVDTQATQPIGSNQYQRALYNFTNKYTNVKSVDLVYIISANNYDPRPLINYYITEIGFFADSQVILPNLDVDTDFQIYAPTTCGAFDLGCVSRNLIGEFSNNIYKRLGAENIASGIMNIYDTLFYPVYIVDAAAWQNGIISIYAIIGIGVLYLIVKRVLS